MYARLAVRLPGNVGLRAGLPFGCLFAALLGAAMGFVTFVGSIMGDCAPGPGCHDDDGARIGHGLLLAMPIIVGGALVIWIVASLLLVLLKDKVPPVVLNAVLAAFIVAIVWLAFRPAFDLFLWYSG